jgi:hypothetical protein
MNSQEEETGKVYKEWTDAIDVVRKDLNKYRKISPEDSVKANYDFCDISKPPKFKVGDIVHRLLDAPKNALGHAQNTKKFRTGDYVWEKEPRKITELLYFSGKVPYRYMLSNIDNASFTEAQLKLSKEKEDKYVVKEIIGKRQRNKKLEYQVWWSGYLKKDATWESRDKLVEDGFEPEFKEYEDSLKKKKK